MSGVMVDLVAVILSSLRPHADANYLDGALSKTWPILTHRSKFLVDEVALLQFFLGELQFSFVNSLSSDTRH